LLLQIVELAKSNNITVLSDEVYRPLFHSSGPSEDLPPSIVSLGYENTIATGSLSKAYSLAGIRVGWLASRSNALVNRIREARHYTTISVSIVDSHIAAYALEANTVQKLLHRNMELARTNLRTLEDFVNRHADVCSWARPRAGSTAFIRFERRGEAVDAQELCRRLVLEAGVLLVPGDLAFGSPFKGFVRFGFVCDADVLKEGLATMEIWMKKNYNNIPLAADVYS
jgi:aspartate/methionine/tyrosine aminotransferase